MKAYQTLIAGLTLILVFLPTSFGSEADSSDSANETETSGEFLNQYLPAAFMDPLQQAEEEFLVDFPLEEIATASDALEVYPQSELPPVDTYALYAPYESIQTLVIPLEPGRLSTATVAAFEEVGLRVDEALDRVFRVKRFPRRAKAGDTLEIKLARTREDASYELEALFYHHQGELEPVALYRFTPADKFSTGYYDEQGYEWSERLLNSPVRYRTISSFLGDGRKHRGLDLRAFVGTPVKAPYRAKVERINWYMGTQGRCVQLLYLDLGIRAKFFHLSKVDPNIRVGQLVDPGDIVGFSGNTGRSTGPHLHYQLEDIYTLRILNPMEIHGYGTPRLGSGERMFLEAKIAAIRAHDTALSIERNARATSHTAAAVN